MIRHNQAVMLVIPGGADGETVKTFGSSADLIEYLLDNTETPPMYAYDPAQGQEKCDQVFDPEKVRADRIQGNIPTINTGMKVDEATGYLSLSDAMESEARRLSGIDPSMKITPGPTKIAGPNDAMLFRDMEGCDDMPVETEVCEAEPEQTFPAQALKHRSPF